MVWPKVKKKIGSQKWPLTLHVTIDIFPFYKCGKNIKFHVKKFLGTSKSTTMCNSNITVHYFFINFNLYHYLVNLFVFFWSNLHETTQH
jgi:hypothetical protein